AETVREIGHVDPGAVADLQLVQPLAVIAGLEHDLAAALLAERLEQEFLELFAVEAPPRNGERLGLRHRRRGRERSRQNERRDECLVHGHPFSPPSVAAPLHARPALIESLFLRRSRFKPAYRA